NLDFVIKAGETTAIVSPSGAGKTTIADLLMGLIVPNQGRILVDEKELNHERIKA
ncbi:MAG: phospholipid-lipopolysaccharide ABC transporter, partial [Deltaproteobacteria bacterium CG_4_8_14_3_um_filter_45_9]